MRRWFSSAFSWYYTILASSAHIPFLFEVDLLSDFDPDGAIFQWTIFCFEMQKPSEEEWKSTFVESKKKLQDDVSPEELSLINAILSLRFLLHF